MWHRMCVCVLFALVVRESRAHYFWAGGSSSARDAHFVSAFSVHIIVYIWYTYIPYIFVCLSIECTKSFAAGDAITPTHFIYEEVRF